MMKDFQINVANSPLVAQVFGVHVATKGMQVLLQDNISTKYQHMIG